MNSDRDALIHAIDAALQAFEEASRGKSLLAQQPPGDAILSPLSDAISCSAAYKAVAGHILFSANAGSVLLASNLALPLLYRAEWTQRDGRGVDDAADWLIRMLGTRDADGAFKAAIWGLSVDSEASLGNDVWLIPFDRLPSSSFKKRLSDRAGKLWNAVWTSERYFDLPGAAIVRRVHGFPYIRADNASFERMSELIEEAYDLSVFLQARTAGRPLALAYWFEYDDADLDLNAHENYASWLLPEVVPRIHAHVVADSRNVVQDLKALKATPADWRKDLIRSMERFTLSQCRRQPTDRILDLTLAFEIAVSGKSSEQAPQSWKVSVRSAQMIGGSLQNRQENRQKISKLYALRNKGAHGSSLDTVRSEHVETVLTEAEALYGPLLESFWRHQVRPDWPAIELGPAYPRPG